MLTLPSSGPSSRLLAGLAALALGLAACGGTAGTDAGADAAASDEVVAAAEGVTVVATTSILGDVARQVVGDAGQVEVLMGPGVDPHAFQPSAAQAAALREADLVLANGLDLEEGLLDALAAAEEDGVRVLELAPQLDPIEYEGSLGHGEEDHDDDHADEDHAVEDEHADDEHGDGDHADEDDHDHGPLDPHVWFDPTRMATGVELLAAELEEVAPDGGWGERAEAYAAELRALDDELAGMLDAVPVEQRRIVTNHEAIGYLAARYDLEVVETVLPGSSADAGPDAQGFAELIETLEREGVRAIFAENTASDRLAASLAGELGEQVVVVELFTDALGEPGSGAETYVDLLRTDVELVVDALT